MGLIDANKLRADMANGDFWTENDYIIAADIIDDQPIVNEWISCNNLLPFAEYGESDNVFVTTKNEFCSYLHILYFDGGNWCYPTGEPFIDEVVAWMPLPKPYKEGYC